MRPRRRRKSRFDSRLPANRPRLFGGLTSDFDETSKGPHESDTIFGGYLAHQARRSETPMFRDHLHYSNSLRRQFDSHLATINVVLATPNETSPH